MEHLTEVFIHVGIPKTGSTFLQKSVFPSLEGFYYYQKDEFLRTRINELPNYSFSDDVEVLAREIELYLKEKRIEKLLISNESLFGHPLHNFLNHELLSRNLRRIFPQAKILVIIRNQVDFFESLYKYVVYLGYPISKNIFFRYSNNRFQRWGYNKGLNTSVFSLDYNRLIRIYELSYGQKNITILPYEALKLDSEKFKIGLEIWVGQRIKNYPTQESVNAGLTQFQLSTLFLVNGLFCSSISNGFGLIPRRPFRNYLLSNFEKSSIFRIAMLASSFIDPRRIIRTLDNHPFSKKAIVFSAAQKEFICSYYQASNAELSKRYDLKLEDYKYNCKG